jgi:hypothetical protein
MGIVCLSECPACARHLRCGERSCPFCGARVTSLMRVLDYRLQTSLNRSRLFSLGAALAAAGIAVNCEPQPAPMYGGACRPPAPSCGGFGGMSGNVTGGTSGNTSAGGTDGAGTAGSTAAAGKGGAPTTVGEGGAAGESPGGGGADDGGGAGGQAGGVGEGGIGGAH